MCLVQFESLVLFQTRRRLGGVDLEDGVCLEVCGCEDASCSVAVFGFSVRFLFFSYGEASDVVSVAVAAAPAATASGDAVVHAVRRCHRPRNSRRRGSRAAHERRGTAR